MKGNEPYERSCRICEHATLLENPEHCLCDKRGVVYSYGVCRRFRPDLFKFSPPARSTDTFAEVDFGKE